MGEGDSRIVAGKDQPFTAAGARINLGSTATGDAIFIAATQQAAWTALGIAPAGVVNGGTF
jgi:hypothetical protein